MTPNEVLQEKLSSWQPAGRQTLTVPDPETGWTVELTADRSDGLGCLLWEMTLRRSAAPVQGGEAALRAWAERVARRATGLLETLTVVEVDALLRVAQLRSQEPARRGEERSYYEVLLKAAGEASVRRYHASRQPDQRREQVPFALTHEAVAKLALDLTAEQ